MVDLVVEDGTNVDGANAYIDVDFLKAYHDDRGSSLNNQSADELARKIIQATSEIDHHYRWKGFRTFGREQALMFPRAEIVDSDGEEIPDGEIPTELKHAIAEGAFRLIAADRLFPDVTETGIRSESSQVGPLQESRTYLAGAPGPPRYRIIDNLLRDLIDSGITTQLERA